MSNHGGPAPAAGGCRSQSGGGCGSRPRKSRPQPCSTCRADLAQQQPPEKARKAEKAERAGGGSSPHQPAQEAARIKSSSARRRKRPASSSPAARGRSATPGRPGRRRRQGRGRCGESARRREESGRRRGESRARMPNRKRPPRRAALPMLACASPPRPGFHKHSFPAPAASHGFPPRQAALARSAARPTITVHAPNPHSKVDATLGEFPRHALRAGRQRAFFRVAHAGAGFRGFCQGDRLQADRLAPARFQAGAGSPRSECKLERSDAILPLAHRERASRWHPGA